MVEIKHIENTVGQDSPGRIMKYVLLYCSEGALQIRIDEQDFTLTSDEVITITSGQYHQIRKPLNSIGYILEFSLDFFCKDDNDIELIFHNGLFCHFAMNEVIPIHNDFILSQLQLIDQELRDKPYQYLISIHSRIELILVAINRAKVQRGDEIWKPDALFLKFLEAVRSSFDKKYTLSDFAQSLGTTEQKLNELAKLHTGKTAQNVIYGLITSEAKRLITYDELSVKEVAFRLGFNDPFYFSNFFKKQTGLSPKLYKERQTR